MKCARGARVFPMINELRATKNSFTNFIKENKRNSFVTRKNFLSFYQIPIFIWFEIMSFLIIWEIIILPSAIQLPLFSIQYSIYVDKHNQKENNQLSLKRNIFYKIISFPLHLDFNDSVLEGRYFSHRFTEKDKIKTKCKIIQFAFLNGISNFQSTTISGNNNTLGGCDFGRSESNIYLKKDGQYLYDYYSFFFHPYLFLHHLKKNLFQCSDYRLKRKKISIRTRTRTRRKKQCICVSSSFFPYSSVCGLYFWLQNIFFERNLSLSLNCKNELLNNKIECIEIFNYLAET